MRDSYFYFRYASALRKVFKVPASHKGKARLPTGIARQFDYETESVLAFGPGCCNIPENEAPDVVAGYTIGDDFSAPELQTQTSQFLAGKASDGFASIGPWLVTADRGPDTNAIRIRTIVNIKSHHDWITNYEIFDCRRLISFVTGIMTTKPGGYPFHGFAAGRDSPL